ncbi:MAG: hypothetical protein A3J75_07480, partial [Acidobacteria bacterium RBG_16_68_9]
MPRRLRLSLALPVHATSFAHTLAVARAAERGEFDGVWVPDHLVNLAGAESGVLECWTVLSAVAAVTARVFVGPLVLTAAFRHPPLLAKQAATLDSLSPGRLVLGLGGGGFTYDTACAQLGFSPLPPRDRAAQLEETIHCLRRLWANDPASVAGRFARARAARLYPRPSRPIPIVVAARRPLMLRVAARHADGWNCPPPHELEAGLAAIEANGRGRATIEVSTYVVAVIGADDAAARQNLARAGRAAAAFGDVERHHL